MEYMKDVCPNCFYESKELGVCSKCNVTLIARCPVCGNPTVGEHTRQEEQDTQRM